MEDSLQVDTCSDEFTLLSMPADGEMQLQFRGLNDHLVDSATIDLSSDELVIKFRDVVKENMDLKDMARQSNSEIRRHTDILHVWKQQIADTSVHYNSMIQEARTIILDLNKKKDALKIRVTEIEEEKRRSEAEFTAISAQLRLKITELEKTVEKCQKENHRFHVLHLQMKEELTSAQSDWDSLKEKYDELQSSKNMLTKMQVEVQQQKQVEKDLRQKIQGLEQQVAEFRSQNRHLTEFVPSTSTSDEKCWRSFDTDMKSAQSLLNDYLQGCKDLLSWISTCKTRLENSPSRNDIAEQLMLEICSFRYNLVEEMERRNNEKLHLHMISKFVESALGSKTGDNVTQASKESCGNAAPKEQDHILEGYMKELQVLQESYDNVKACLIMAEEEIQKKCQENADAEKRIGILQSEKMVLKGQYTDKHESYNRLSMEHASLSSQHHTLVQELENNQKPDRSRKHSDFKEQGRGYAYPAGDTAFNVLYSCPKCQFTFKGLQALNNHMDICLSVDGP